MYLKKKNIYHSAACCIACTHMHTGSAYFHSNLRGLLSSVSTFPLPAHLICHILTVIAPQFSWIAPKKLSRGLMGRQQGLSNSRMAKITPIMRMILKCLKVPLQAWEQNSGLIQPQLGPNDPSSSFALEWLLSSSVSFASISPLLGTLSGR